MVLDSSPAAAISISHSLSAISPRRSRCWSMPVSMERRRCTNCSALISRLKKATTLRYLAALRAEVHRQRCLSNRRPGRQDDQIRLLKTAQQFIQLGEPDGHTEDLVLVPVQIINAIHHIVHHQAHRRQVTPDAPLRHVEDELLGAINHFVDVLSLFIGQGRDLARRADQPAQGGRALHDVGVVLNIDGGRDVVDQRGDVGRAAHLLQQVAPLQLIHQGDKVGRLAALVQVKDCLIDPPFFSR